MPNDGDVQSLEIQEAVARARTDHFSNIFPPMPMDFDLLYDLALRP